MVGDHNRRFVHIPHMLERLDHLGLGISGRISRPGIPRRKTALEFLELLSFVVRVRHDHAAVIRAGRVELHRVELHNLGYGFAGKK